jgi:heterotetrameric sarcosine oxidase gamma subunit
MLQPNSVLGGRFGQRSRIAAYNSEDSVLYERSDIGCVRLTSAVNAADVATYIEHAVGMRLPTEAGPIAAWEDKSALWLSPRDWLIQCSLESESDIVGQLNAAFPDKCLHAVPYTDALCWLELAGDGAHEVLADGGFISLQRQGLPVRHAKRTLLSHIPVMILRQTSQQWLLGTERSRAAYFLRWLCSAAEAREVARSTQDGHFVGAPT